MAAASSPITVLLPKNKHFHNFKNLNDDTQFPLLLRQSSNFHKFSYQKPPNRSREVVVRRAIPEVPGDLLTSFPGLEDNPWIAGVFGLMAAGMPFMMKKLAALSDKPGEVAKPPKNDEAKEELKQVVPLSTGTNVQNILEKMDNISNKMVEIGNKLRTLEEMVEKTSAKVEKAEESLKKVAEEGIKKVVETVGKTEEDIKKAVEKVADKVEKAEEALKRDTSYVAQNISHIMHQEQRLPNVTMFHSRREIRGEKPEKRHQIVGEVLSDDQSIYYY